MLHLQISTIIFQILNFVILLAVLSWFLYRPLLRVMRDREQMIAGYIRDAEDAGRSAEAERARLEEQNRAAVAQAESLLESARTGAADEREQILVSGKAEVARMAAEAQEATQEQERLALAQLQRRMRESAVALAGSLIREAAGPAVHQQLLARVLEQGIRPAASDDGQSPVIRLHENQTVDVELGYPPAEQTEAELRAVLARDLGLEDGGASISFRVNASLLAGLRVLAGEFVLDFNLRQTLRRLVAEDGTPAVTP